MLHDAVMVHLVVGEKKKRERENEKASLQICNKLCLMTLLIGCLHCITRFANGYTTMGGGVRDNGKVKQTNLVNVLPKINKEKMIYVFISRPCRVPC